MTKKFDKLTNIGAVCQSEPCEEPIKHFLYKEKNGLNRKSFNGFIFTPHFKLEGYRTAKKLLSRNTYSYTYMGTIDAYFSISVHNDYRKPLRLN